jgi:glutathione S-transferase
VPKLYHHPISGHAHRARLFMALLGIPTELITVDLTKAEHKGEAFLALNPFGQVPVLVDDDGMVIPDSNAILVYLAKKYGRTDWLPDHAAGAARVQRWLSVAAGEIVAGPGRARLIVLFGIQTDPAEVIARAHGVLMLIDAELSETKSGWIAADHPTIADVALYSYIARAPEGNVDLAPYRAIGDWLTRVETLPGFVPMTVNRVGLAA